MCRQYLHGIHAGDQLHWQASGRHRVQVGGEDLSIIFVSLCLERKMCLNRKIKKWNWHLNTNYHMLPFVCLIGELNSNTFYKLMMPTRLYSLNIFSLFCRLSFYSGHSSFGMYCMLFLAVSTAYELQSITKSPKTQCKYVSLCTINMQISQCASGDNSPQMGSSENRLVHLDLYPRANCWEGEKAHRGSLCLWT